MVEFVLLKGVCFVEQRGMADGFVASLAVTLTSREFGPITGCEVVTNRHLIGPLCSPSQTNGTNLLHLSFTSTPL